MRAALQTEPDLRVVAESSCWNLVAFVDRIGAGLVVADCRGIDACHIERIRAIRGRRNAVPVIVLSAPHCQCPICVSPSVRVDARLPQRSDPAELVRAARSVLRPTAPSRPKRSSLTRREIEIIQLAAHGLGNRQIGEALCVSATTVKAHLVHIFQKLGASSRVSAVVEAARLGVLDLTAEEPRPGDH